jgi:hypothetical protein
VSEAAEAAEGLAAQIEEALPVRLREFFGSLFRAIEIGEISIAMKIKRAELRRQLLGGIAEVQGDGEIDDVVIEVPAEMKRGRTAKLIVEAAGSVPNAGATQDR